MNNKTFILVIAIATSSIFLANTAFSESRVYANFPVTVKGYKGNTKSSVSYSGQIARHVLHNSLKTLSKQGDATNSKSLTKKMLSYYKGKDANREIIDPVSKKGFPIIQDNIDQISKGKNLAGKTYKGKIYGFLGDMTGPELVEFWIKKAAKSRKGFDVVNGYDYHQLISKFIMGAVFYNQAVDNYLDEKLLPSNKPNGKPYKKGAAYTGKEHVWDEAFGYFGVPANVLDIDLEKVKLIVNSKPEGLELGDANKDGKIDLKKEMFYAHGYYGASFDKTGKSNYVSNITRAFISGRELISSANGNNLSDKQISQLKSYAEIIKSNWELIIAEATFKYAGSVYKDALALHEAVEHGTIADIEKINYKYAHHWGELKGFSLSLQLGYRNIAELSENMNKLIGYSPVLIGGTQVTSINSAGEYVQSKTISLKEYALNMLKLQVLLKRNFNLRVKLKDETNMIADIAKKIGTGNSAEND